ARLPAPAQPCETLAELSARASAPLVRLPGDRPNFRWPATTRRASLDKLHSGRFDGFSRAQFFVSFQADPEITAYLTCAITNDPVTGFQALPKIFLTTHIFPGLFCPFPPICEKRVAAGLLQRAFHKLAG